MGGARPWLWPWPFCCWAQERRPGARAAACCAWRASCRAERRRRKEASRRWARPTTLLRDAGRERGGRQRVAALPLAAGGCLAAAGCAWLQVAWWPGCAALERPSVRGAPTRRRAHLLRPREESLFESQKVLPFSSSSLPVWIFKMTAAARAGRWLRLLKRGSAKLLQSWLRRLPPRLLPAWLLHVERRTRAPTTCPTHAPTSWQGANTSVVHSMQRLVPLPSLPASLLTRRAAAAPPARRPTSSSRSPSLPEQASWRHSCMGRVVPSIHTHRPTDKCCCAPR